MLQRILFVLLGACLLSLVWALPTLADWPRVATSADGTPISYEVHGKGEVTLVLVHGWSCDARYWHQQVPYFADDYQVVTIDLAGHGHSGQARDRFTMAAFAEDVQAVVDAIGDGPLILVGHSMGGPVIVEAAQLIPDRVIGLIGIDTFQDVAGSMSPDDWEEIIGPLRHDFAASAPGFVSQMLSPATDSALREWIIADMAAAPPRVAMSAMDEMVADYASGRSLEMLSKLEVPLVAINAPFWPTNIEGNREHVPGFDAVIIEDSDHFLHMAMPGRFNDKLARVIEQMIER